MREAETAAAEFLDAVLELDIVVDEKFDQEGGFNAARLFGSAVFILQHVTFEVAKAYYDKEDK